MRLLRIFYEDIMQVYTWTYIFRGIQHFEANWQDDGVDANKQTNTYYIYITDTKWNNAKYATRNAELSKFINKGWQIYTHSKTWKPRAGPGVTSVIYGYSCLFMGTKISPFPRKLCEKIYPFSRNFDNKR